MDRQVSRLRMKITGALDGPKAAGASVRGASQVKDVEQKASEE